MLTKAGARGWKPFKTVVDEMVKASKVWVGGKSGRP